jgi:pimeloyl-ACP methyl ester carboxylesterase
MSRYPRARAAVLAPALLACLVVVAVGGGALAAKSGSSSSSSSSTAVTTGCQREIIPVMLSPSSSTTYRVAGWLCGQLTPQPSTVQVLVSGLTYDHRYWDLPYESDQYSYVRAATKAGDIVLNIDRIGVGESDRPPAADVTIPAEAYVTHQIVQSLRARFRTVIGVGHSMGSAILMEEAAMYKDFDGLILSGYLHQTNPVHIKEMAPTYKPAAGDPRFAGTTVPAGYLTTAPGAATRMLDFYASDDASATVVGYDNQFTQTFTPGEIGGISLARNPAVAKAIQVPVLLATGQDDALACNAAAGLSCQDGAAICQREASFYPAVARLTAYVMPAAGHSMNLHYHAAQWFDAALNWVADQTGGHRPLAWQTC